MIGLEVIAKKYILSIAEKTFASLILYYNQRVKPIKSYLKK